MLSEDSAIPPEEEENGSVSKLSRIQLLRHVADLEERLEEMRQRVLPTEEAVSKAAAYDALVIRLHEHQNHPDYCYETREHGYKSSEDHDPPLGFGWTSNVHMGRDGWERFDHSEETYWMRLKTDKDKDELTRWDLPRVVMAPVSHEELLQRLREKTNSGYMPSSMKDGFNSKPEYTGVLGLLNLHAGTSYYAVNTSVVDPMTELTQQMTKLFKTDGFPSSGIIYAGIELPNMQILTCLHNDQTALRIKNKAGHFGKWDTWDNDLIPIDRFLLQEAIDLL